MRHPAFVPFFALLVAAGCGGDVPEGSLGAAAAVQDPALSASPTATIDKRFVPELLAAARQYRKWERVSDHPNVAPERCASPAPATVRHSTSDDDDTHGKKLYFLFAKDAPTYTALTWFESREPSERDAIVQKLVGQVVVKQTWKAVDVAVAAVPLVERKQYGDRVPAEDHMIVGDKAYRTGMPGDLFVMLKLDPTTPGTDQGWVYGTVNYEGNTVTSAGRVASCMECREDAPRDRLFGLGRSARRTSTRVK